jgi:WD40 repeat protein
MMLSRQNVKVIITALFLSIATVEKDRQAIAGEQVQLAQDRASVSTAPKEEYITRLFDLSGKELAQFEGQLYRFSPNGQRLLTLSSAGFQLQYLFDVSGKRLLQFKANTAQFSPDGQRMVTMSEGIAHLYDAMGRELTQLPESQGTSIFSPNGQRLIILANDSAYLLNSSGRQIAQIQGHFLETGSGFDLTGQRFILYRSDSPTTCDLFDSSGQPIVRLPKECAGVTPDGQRFLIGTGTLDEPSLRLYDFAGQEIAQLSGAFPTFSLDRRFILTTDFYGGNSSYLYNSSGEKVAQLQGKNGRFSPTNQRLITVSGNTVHLYNLSGQEVTQLPGHFAAFLPGSEKFLTYLPGKHEKQPLDISGGETRLFDGSGRELALLTGDPSLYEITQFGAGSLSQISQFLKGSFSFLSADGQYLVTTDGQSSYLYNASGEKVAELQGVFLRFNSTGQNLITFSEGKIRLFDRSGAKLLEIEGEFASFSPDGQRLAIAARNTLPLSSR